MKRWNCSNRTDLTETEVRENTTSHYRYHWRRKEEPCLLSMAANTGMSYLRDHGTLDGWEYTPRPQWDCEDWAGWTPQEAHRTHHRNQGEAPCPLSLMEQTAHSYQTTNGEAWQEKIWNCAADDGSVQCDHHNYHRRITKSPQCEPARLQNRRYHRQYRTGTPEETDRTMRAHKVYQFTFLNGDRYYGITFTTMKERLRRHLATTGYEIGDRLRNGEAYVLDVLCEAPDQAAAQKLERMMIRAGNPHGRILNIRHNPEHDGQTDGYPAFPTKPGGVETLDNYDNSVS